MSMAHRQLASKLSVHRSFATDLDSIDIDSVSTTPQLRHRRASRRASAGELGEGALLASMASEPLERPGALTLGGNPYQIQGRRPANMYHGAFAEICVGSSPWHDHPQGGGGSAGAHEAPAQGGKEPLHRHRETFAPTVAKLKSSGLELKHTDRDRIEKARERERRRTSMSRSPERLPQLKISPGAALVSPDADAPLGGVEDGHGGKSASMHRSSSYQELHGKEPWRFEDEGRVFVRDQAPSN